MLVLFAPFVENMLYIFLIIFMLFRSVAFMSKLDEKYRDTFL